MHLKTYLESRNLDQSEFANMIGVTPVAISNYVCKKRLPSLKIGRMIEIATRGKVKIDDLIEFFEKKED